MKNMKRILTLALAVMMLLSMAMPAFAADDDYIITITNSDTVSSAGHKYHAYQIFSGKLDSTQTILTEIQWGQNIKDNADAFLAALKADKNLGEGTANIFYNAVTADDVAGILATPANHTSVVLEAFAKAATANISGNPVASSAQTDAPYTIAIPADMAGYYLIQDDASVLAGQENKDVSDFILQVIKSVSVEHKGSIPTMDKQVSETGSTYHDYIATGVGETHYYRIVAELPDDYRLYDKYYLEFSDKMSKGLTFDKIIAVKALVRSSGNEVALDANDYAVTTTPIADDAAVMPGGTHLRVVIEDLKTAQAATGERAVLSLTANDAIEIIYTAKVNEDAVVDGNGIPNQATIIYSNDPNTEGKGESTPDETNVYPINLKLVKVDGKDQTVKLEGAKFILARPHSDGVETHNEYAVVDANGKIAGWVHHYDGDGCAADNTAHTDAAAEGGEGLASVLTTDENGEINVSGLDAGRYTLIEIAPPDGYNKLTEAVDIAVDITVDDNGDVISGMTGNTDQGKIEFDVANATVKLTIDNYKGDVLPSTGGMGTTLFYAVGGIMVLAAVVLLVTKKRMSVAE